MVLKNLEDLFSLTPALSRWEREKRSLSFGELKAAFCFTTCEFYVNTQRLFPLPRGEGQVERKVPQRITSQNIF
jgi:hypothetical protein